MSKSISILLGAGFSAPMKFPLGKDLSDKIFNSASYKISFNNEGVLVPCELQNPHTSIYRFLVDEIFPYYKQLKRCFDYEQFFDFLIGEARNDKVLESRFDNLWKNRTKCSRYENYFGDVESKYQQLVSYHIKSVPIRGSFIEYRAFLKWMENVISDYEINIHTLNHDLLLETLVWRNYKLHNEFCDGFDYENSPYKGLLKSHDWVTLPCYSGIYDKKIRLFKLHGSIDQHIQLKNDNGALMYGNHIKIKSITDIDKIRKYDTDGAFEESYISYLYPDFLTGVKSKEKKYNASLYEKLFGHFVDSLKNTDCLIIIGYGAKDEGINKLIRDEFDHHNKSCFIYDLKPSDALRNFAREINVNEIIEKSVEEFELPNF